MGLSGRVKSRKTNAGSALLVSYSSDTQLSITAEGILRKQRRLDASKYKHETNLHLTESTPAGISTSTVRVLLSALGFPRLFLCCEAPMSYFNSFLQPCTASKKVSLIFMVTSLPYMTLSLLPMLVNMLK